VSYLQRCDAPVISRDDRMEYEQYLGTRCTKAHGLLAHSDGGWGAVSRCGNPGLRRLTNATAGCSAHYAQQCRRDALEHMTRGDASGEAGRQRSVFAEVTSVPWFALLNADAE
jgi:hypothetical protein